MQLQNIIRQSGFSRKCIACETKPNRPTKILRKNIFIFSKKKNELDDKTAIISNVKGISLEQNASINHLCNLRKRRKRKDFFFLSYTPALEFS